MKPHTVLAAAFIFLSILNNCNQKGISDNHFNVNFTGQARLWRTGVDSYGSKAVYDGELVKNNISAVEFTICRRSDEAPTTPWVELICDIKNTLQGASAIVLEYKCESDLLIKLSQKDFGAEGNATYAHYQFRLPSTDKWLRKEFDFSGFKQPEWAPEHALGIPMKIENVDAIYLVPDLDYNVGETAELKVRKLLLKK